MNPSAGVSHAPSHHGPPPPDLSLLDGMLGEHRGDKGAVIAILQRAQDLYGYLPREVISTISRQTRIPISRLYGVATFYAQFRLAPHGKHVIRVCDGTACHVRGARKSVEAVARATGAQPGQTSEDFKYTLEIVYCLGSCGLSPVALVDDKVYGRLSPEALIKQIDELN